MLAAGALDGLGEVVVKALMATPVTRNSFLALAGQRNVSLPFSFLGFRVAEYARGYTAYVMKGGPETARVLYSSMIAGAQKDCLGNLSAHVALNAAGLVENPHLIVRLGNVFLESPKTGTTGLAPKDANDVGSSFFLFADNTLRVGDSIPLSGITEAGDVVNPMAPIMHALFPLSQYAEQQNMWDRQLVSYQGRQSTVDRRGNPMVYAGAGPFGI